MEVGIVGGGRLGLPIAKAALASGAKVSVLTRESKPGPGWPRGAQYLDQDAVVQFPSFDLVVLALPAQELRRATLGAKVPAFTPIASAIADLPLRELAEHFPRHLLARFMCTAAIVEEGGVIFHDSDSDPRVLEGLLQCLPQRCSQPVPSDHFDRYTRILVAAPLICAAVSQIQTHTLGGDLSPRENQLLIRMLSEAEMMIRSNGGNPDRALQSALTPGGITDREVARIFKTG
ncbi:hypothetical protein [Mycobacterium spongiae]|uniref:Uncharacterized protein n=1 Tax=Mycobacterium spongiae TaxID=886343 RepID=A0A975PYM2_9MYCO|nr:hypothetical protein [Mycobacterium spongiae]QUR68938.1 hypothetical protein F6B93_19330 [Mycobacterium spongiae]